MDTVIERYYRKTLYIQDINIFLKMRVHNDGRFNVHIFLIVPKGIRRHIPCVYLLVELRHSKRLFIKKIVEIEESSLYRC